MNLALALTLGQSASTGTAVTYDYYIDAANGNDANDGSEGAPWASLNKISTVVAAGETRKVLVKSGVYATANDNLTINAPADSTLDVTFEPGCAMDGTVNGTTTRHAVQVYGSGTLILRGNGLLITEYGGDNRSFSNALRYFGTATLIAYDCVLENCSVGINGDQTGHGEFHRCETRGHWSYQILNTGDCTMDAHDCLFQPSSDSPLTNITSTGKHRFFACAFDPIGAPPPFVRTGGRNVEISRCRIGSETHRVQVTPPSDGSGGVLIEDCYINMTSETYPGLTMRRCFGKLSVRQRTAPLTGEWLMENCVITGSDPVHSGDSMATAIFASSFDNGGCGRITCRNNIFATGLDVADFWNTARNQYAIDAGCVWENNVLFGGASYAPELASLFTNVVSGDPVIGTGTGYDPDQYGYGPGSSAIGAGTGGSNIGFAVGEVPQNPGSA